MVKVNKVLIILLVVFICARNTIAEDVTVKLGNELLMDCKTFLNLFDGVIASPSSQQYVNGKECASFIEGFTTGHNALATKLALEASIDNSEEYTSKFRSISLFCMPGAYYASNGNIQAIRVVVKYLEDHPEELHKTPGELVGSALDKAFPCN